MMAGVDHPEADTRTATFDNPQDPSPHKIPKTRIEGSKAGGGAYNAGDAAAKADTSRAVMPVRPKETSPHISLATRTESSKARG